MKRGRVVPEENNCIVHLNWRQLQKSKAWKAFFALINSDAHCKEKNHPFSVPSLLCVADDGYRWQLGKFHRKFPWSCKKYLSVIWLYLTAQKAFLKLAKDRWKMQQLWKKQIFSASGLRAHVHLWKELTLGIPFFSTANATLVQTNGSALNFLQSRTQLETVEYFLLLFVNTP